PRLALRFHALDRLPCRSRRRYGFGPRDGPWSSKPIVQPASLLPRLHHIEPELAGAHDRDRDTERDHEIEDAEYHQRRDDFLAAELGEGHQHCRIEHAEAAGRVA